MILTTRTIKAEDVRQACIENDWYTRGTNKEYDRMLGMCSGELTEELLERIVVDIVSHSDLEEADIESVAWYIVNQVAWYNIEVCR